MDRKTFQLHLNVAVAAMRVKCQSYITNTLPHENLYYIINVERIDRWTPLDEEKVLEHLWRDGRVPVWIDVTPYEEDGKHIYFELRCGGGFSETIFYHKEEGYPPFHCFGPLVPPGWTRESPKFNLHHYREWMRVGLDKGKGPNRRSPPLRESGDSRN
jgi:hypothetical protein